MRKVPYVATGERDKLGVRFQGPLRIVEADPNGVTYRAKYLVGLGKIVQLHVNQFKRFHGDWSGPDLGNLPPPNPQRLTRNRVSIPTNESEVLGIDWNKLRGIPLNFTDVG